MFQHCCDGDRYAKKNQKGGGCRHKLPEDNEGMIAGAAALNGSASPSMATEILSTVNKATYPDQNLKICCNTFMWMLRAYIDFEDVAILRQKTGSKDPESDWAKARVVIATQMKEQIELGQQIDNSETTLQQVFDDVEKSNMPPPIFLDAILYGDENHCTVSIGGAGHDG